MHVTASCRKRELSGELGQFQHRFVTTHGLAVATADNYWLKVREKPDRFTRLNPIRSSRRGWTQDVTVFQYRREEGIQVDSSQRVAGQQRPILTPEE